METHLVVKPALLPCHNWIHYCVLFLITQHVSAYHLGFLSMVVSFFSSFFSLSSKESTPLSSFLYVCQFQSFYFLLFIVILGPVIKVLVIFNLVIELQFFIYYFFLFSPFFFWLFSLGSFVKVFLIFNFIIQLKFMFFIVFNLTLILLIYFPFC